MKLLILGNGYSGCHLANQCLVSKFGQESIEKIHYYHNDSNNLYLHYLSKNITTEYINKDKARIPDEYLKLFRPDLIMSCGWAYLVPAEIVDSIPCYNFHPSLLPANRRKTFMNQNLNSKDYTGITLHRMNAVYDEGPIYKQIAFQISNAKNNIEFIMKGIKAMDILLNDFCSAYSESITLYPQELYRETILYV